MQQAQLKHHIIWNRIGHVAYLSLQNCCTVCKVHFRLIMNVKSVRTPENKLLKHHNPPRQSSVGSGQWVGGRGRGCRTSSMTQV